MVLTRKGISASSEAIIKEQRQITREKLLASPGLIIGTIGFFLFAAFVCDSLKNQPAAMCICGAPFAFSYFINAAVLKKFEFFWFVRYGFFAEWMRGRRIGVTPGVWGVWYALLLGGLLLAAIHQRKERKEL